jgi:uncharacterized membrane protein YuzA (DUF378 family)
MYKLSIIDKISLLLVVIGSINWGLVGLFNFNLVGFALGNIALLERLVYILVGLSGVNTLLFIMRCRSKK